MHHDVRIPVSSRWLLLTATAALVTGLLVGSTSPVASAAVDLNDCWSTDNTDPVLEDISVAPQSIDASTTPQTVTYTAEASDSALPGAPTGHVRRVEVSVTSPGGLAVKIARLHPDASGDLTGTITFPTWSFGGTWTVQDVLVVDDARNRVFVDADDFPPSLSADLEVTSGPHDGTAPTLKDLSFRPGTVDARRDVKRVVVTARATDGGSGIDELFVTAESARDEDFETSARLSRVSGTTSKFRGELRITRWVGTSRWHIVDVFISDLAENSAGYSRQNLEGMGLPTSFKVVSNSDTRIPKPVGLKLTPKVVDARTADGYVTVSVHATDAASGVKSMFAAFDAPMVRQRARSLRLVSGNRNDGRWTGVVRIPRCQAKDGVYRLSIGITDRAGNNPAYETDVLSQLGLPSKVTVQADDHQPPQASLTGSTPTEYSFAFDEDVTGISGASAAILDANGEGSPVDGSWSCQDATAQATACETGQVRTATFTADVAAPDGTTYGLVMNPEGNLDARDLDGNPFLPRSIYTFTV